MFRTQENRTKIFAVVVCLCAIVLTAGIASGDVVTAVRYDFSGTVTDKDEYMPAEFDQFLGETITGSFVMFEDPNVRFGYSSLLEDFTMSTYSAVGGNDYLGHIGIFQNGDPGYSDRFYIDNLQFHGDSVGGGETKFLELYLDDKDGLAWSSIDGLPVLVPVSQFEIRSLRVVFGFPSGAGTSAGRLHATLDELQMTPIPEPGAVFLLSSAVATLLLKRRKALKSSAYRELRY